MLAPNIFMRSKVNRICVLIIMVLFSGCAVVKTPFPDTSYYRETQSRLDNIKRSTVCLNDSIYAGFSRVSITPFLFSKTIDIENNRFNKVPMAGFGQRRGKSATGIHDSLFIKSVALREGAGTFIIVSGDMLIMPPNIIDAVTSLLVNDGINRNQVFFSATHTHSSLGGWAYGIVGRQFAGKENKQIEKWLIKKIHEAVIASISDMQPSRIGYGEFEAGEFTRNRLVGSNGIKNNLFNYIVVEQKCGRKAIIGMYSAHATVLNEKNLELSGDYPGYWERRVEGKGAYLGMFCGGSMGSQSPVGPDESFALAESIGNGLADRMLSQLKNTQLKEKNVLSSVSLKISLPEYHFRLTKNINLTTGLSKRLMPLPENVYLQGLRIGSLIWIFTPGDFSGEYAVELSDRLSHQGYNITISGYNGSYLGYIIPGKYFNLNHYEPRMMGWFGPQMGDYIMDLIMRIVNVLSNC
jgi:neutral ceramidase